MATTYGTSGNDTMSGTTGSDTIAGEGGNDSISGNSGTDSLYGGAGNDTISGGGGDDAMYGGTGDDTLTGDDGYDRIYGDDGDDTLYGGSGAGSYDDLYGGTGNDTLFSSDSDDNWSYGGAGDDTVYGGSSNDDIYGDEGNDALYGGEGVDSVYGGDGNDYVEAGGGNDLIRGEEGNDTLYGGDGDDTFEMLDVAGNDSIYGGSGQDTVSFLSDSDVNISYDADTQQAAYTQNAGGSTGIFDGIEEIETGGGNDTIDASDLASSVTVTSGAGDDNIYGGYGDDAYYGGAGSDSIDGNNGNDTLFGGDGDDSVLGGLGDDIVYGGTGDDYVDGGSGSDTLFGGDGSDWFDSGTGDDTITTGSGEDTLRFEQGGNDDVVTDFDIGDTDGNGYYNDQFDVSALQNPDGSPVRVGDVSVSDDGSGNAKLTFPEGETVVLQGVAPAQMSTNAQLHAAGIPCFTPGAMIATPQGERAIETLQVGDRVMTRDHGLQPIRWIGQRTVAAQDKFAPILIRPGVVTGLEKPLLVSPQHRMLFTGYRAELLFGESEVLLAAKHLIDGHDVTREEGGDVTYIHMLFDTHEVVYANGAATESFHPGEEGVAAVDDAARAELFALFPALRGDLTQYGQTARRCLRKHEAQMVRM